MKTQDKVKPRLAETKTTAQTPELVILHYGPISMMFQPLSQTDRPTTVVVLLSTFELEINYYYDCLSYYSIEEIQHDQSCQGKLMPYSSNMVSIILLKQISNDRTTFTSGALYIRNLG